MVVKTKRVRFSQAAARPAKAAARQLAVFAAVLLCSRGIVFGQYAPFAVAAVAAVPYSGLLSAVLGGAAGYLLPSAASVPVHYLAALLAAGAIRWTLNDLVRLRMHPIFAPAAACLPLLVTSAAIVAVNGSGFSTAMMYLAESLLAGCAAYFFRRTLSAVRSGRGAGEWSAQEAACGAFSAGIFLLSFSGLSIGGVSVGRILAVIAILFAARYGGVAGGSVAGTAAGLVFSLSTSGLNYLSGAYALGGLTAGLFSPLGRLASAAAFVVSNGVASLQVGSQKNVVSGLYEVAAATVIYLIIPPKAGGSFIGLFSRGDDADRAEGFRRSVVMKLDYAAKALDSVSESVEEVSRKLAQTCAPDINGVYRRVSGEVCATCGLKGYCWERGYGGTMGAFNDLTDKLRAKGRVERDDFCSQFRSHCSRLNQILDSVNRGYAEFAVLEAAESRAQQVRDVVAGQFTTVGRMLEDMSAELEMYDRFDLTAAQRVEEVLRLAGTRPLDVSCRIDRFGRMSVEAVAAPAECVRLNRAQLAGEISRVCGKKFEAPCISTAGGKCRIRMNEQPLYRVRTGCTQHVCGGGSLCGDSWTSFPDGNGRQIAIISDGMGTGGRAAVDGAMACGIMERLVKAGIGFDAALKIVNSALLAKSGDESLSTMDIAALDLYSGEVELLKAGAPAAILRKNGRAVVMDMPGLPIGILNETQFARSSDSIGDGDLLVMLSDGALSSGSDWVCEEIEQWNGKLPQELAESLVSHAIARRGDGHDDDITVLALMLSRIG
ncbi:MAG: SpoIIE family protein phosphatase [Oscillospiraceae bacterium]|jgi:stage II sporulation protein E|nr:SpoIIE family protein phosphatase [Oscillospiraceae bacterium]MCI1990145.1 SpoIIE family protein phosphatase [Oscillospiraceae bacterium]MCI2034524.1 SpoIIE family protein phosphatase [Oscillospiraceae bacterium]